MKKIIWLVLIFAALASAGWFVGRPVLERFLAERRPAERLKSADEAKDSFAEEGWIRQEKVIYRRRDIPSLEKEFEAVGVGKNPITRTEWRCSCTWMRRGT